MEDLYFHTGATIMHWEYNTGFISDFESNILIPIFKNIYIPVFFYKSNMKMVYLFPSMINLP